MKSLFKILAQLALVAFIGFGLGGCVTTRVPTATTSPWQVVDLNTDANPLDVAFTDANHGFLVGSNRLILETNDAGANWNERSLDLPDEENFRLISIAFDGDDGWIAGQPGLLMHTTDGGQNWTRLFLDTKLPGEPYLITALGPNSAELATNVGAVYRTRDGGGSWDAEVSDAAGAVRDLRRSADGSYVSVSSLGNFYATWDKGQDVWQVHQRVSSQRLQSIGYQPDGRLWMVARGAQIRLNDDASDNEAGASRSSRSPMAMATSTWPGRTMAPSGLAVAMEPCLSAVMAVIAGNAIPKALKPRPISLALCSTTAPTNATPSFWASVA